MASLTDKQKREGGHATPPKGYPKDAKEYADPTNHKYPLDTAEHCRAAMSYLSMPKNRKMYSASEIAAMMRRIKAAGKKFGIDFDKDDK